MAAHLAGPARLDRGAAGRYSRADEMPRKKLAPRRQVTCPSCRHRADPAAGPLNFCPECGAELRARTTSRGAARDVPEEVIADRYRLLSLLGEGGMGSVYKAEHIRMGKALALKILRGDFAREPGAVEAFLAEAQMVSRLSNPHTIAVFDFGEIARGAGFYLAMEYVPGRDLQAVLREEERLPEGRLVQIGQQILSSLAEAHDAGIVHRDVKPGNVMLMQTRSGEDFVKVLDFGIAKLREERGAPPRATAATTGAGAIVGTPSYLAPEQARGEPIDGRADLYAVGCLLHELAAGRPPFEAPSPMAVVSAHLNDPPPPLGRRAPGTSRRLAAVVERALAKRPEDRFPSADAMREALLGAGETSTSWLRRRRPASPRVTGELQIASRDDFRGGQRRGGRVALAAGLALLLAASAAAAWRWADVYAALAARSPRIAALVPPPLRPAADPQGREREPNDDPARASPLALAPGPDGRAGEGAARVRGRVDAAEGGGGDADVFRLEVPPAAAAKVLDARFRGERDAGGLDGIDVALALAREVDPGDPSRAEPVAAADRNGPGAGERLVAAVEPGTHYLTVRARGGAAAAQPARDYLLEVRLADPEPGVEVEPNDGPEAAARGSARDERWRALAARNRLVEGAPVRGELSGDDRDVFAAAPGAALLAAVPAPTLALAARLWSPDAEDLAPGRGADRARLAPAGEGEPGGVLLVAAAPGAGAPALLELRAARGEGSYAVVALGEGAASRDAALGLAASLVAEGRAPAALELVAGHAGRLSGGEVRDALLLAAGRIAEAAAPGLAPAAASAGDRASRALGVAVFHAAEGRVVYRGAFEAAVRGGGRAAEEAQLRLAALAAPCTPDDVAARAERFLRREPPPAAELAEAGRALRARALEDGFWASGGADRARLEAALEAWGALAEAGGASAPEAVLRLEALRGVEPSREGARPVCP